MKHVIILGGGAAGFFAALAVKEANSKLSVCLLEKSSALLSKVRISGGGRCNVTHSCFDPSQLIKNYPRGGKELLGPFNRFQPRDTIEWFNSRDVDLKTEADGRIFPASNSSNTIIHCLQNEAKRLNIDIQTKQRVEKIIKQQNNFLLSLADGSVAASDYLLIATGSHPQGYEFAKAFGHTIQEPIPSLFTFNIPSSPLNDLAGIALEKVSVELIEARLKQTGPLLITHWGFSGPAVLKLSAWAARDLNRHHYKMSLSVDWLPEISKETIHDLLFKMRSECPSQILASKTQFNLPKNLWKRLITLSGIEENKRVSEISKELMNRLCRNLKSQVFQIDGKTTYKEEFVTCGGITLSEINFKTFESKRCEGLYFAGEILDIDAVTGGFNFQNAWTSGWIAGNAIAELDVSESL
jgi:predicted Rossmann fold flavoprotein